MIAELSILIDDTPLDGRASEHGLSIYIETESEKILFDTGQSGGFAANADAGGINLAEVDFAVISHGHYDHGNGLPAFFDRNAEAPVYIHPEAAEPVYYSRNGNSQGRYVGISRSAVDAGLGRFISVAGELRLSERIILIPCTMIENRNPILNDNSLFIRKEGEESTENFNHEIFMVIEGERDFIIISGCSHNNIVSIIEHCIRRFTGKTLKAVVGGFHMPGEPEPGTEYAASVRHTVERLSAFAEQLEAGREVQDHIKLPLYITGHCTGKAAGLMLKAKLDKNIDFFHTGSIFLL